MMNDGGFSKHDHVLAGLVISLQAATMQHLGKVKNPLTDELERDLDQARGTIDILLMLKEKCRQDTPADILRLLDAAVMDLQMNYLEELKKDRAAARQEGQGDKDKAQEHAQDKGQEEGQVKEQDKEQGLDQHQDQGRGTEEDAPQAKDATGSREQPHNPAGEPGKGRLPDEAARAGAPNRTQESQVGKPAGGTKATPGGSKTRSKPSKPNRTTD
jgi:hypothetical protein